MSAEDAAGKLAEVQVLLQKEDRKELEEAADLASEAVDIYKQLKNQKGTHEAMKTVVEVWKAQVEVLKYIKPFGWKYDVEDLGLEINEYCDTAIEEFKTMGDTRGEGIMQICLAQANSEKGKTEMLEKGAVAAAKAVEIMKSLQDEEGLVQAYMAQSNVYFKLMKAAEAKQAAHQAYGVAQKTGSKRLEAQSLLLVALAHGIGRDFHRGYDTHLEVLRLYRELGDRKAQAIQLHTIAQWQMTRQKPKDAVPTAKEALVIFETLGVGRGWMGAALRMLVTAYISRQEFTNATRVTTKCIDKFKESGDKRLQAMGHDILAYVHLAQQEIVEAMEASKTSVELAIGLDDDEWEAECRKTLAIVLNKLDDEEKVIENLEKSEEIWKRLKNPSQQVKTLCRLANVYGKNGNKKANQATFKKAVDVAKASGNFSDEAYVSYIQAEALNHPSMALWHGAAEKAQAAADLYSKVNNHEGQAKALGIVADAKHKLGDLADAMTAAKKAMALAKGGFQLKASGAAMQKVAEIYLDQKQCKMAIKIAKMAKEACVKCDDHLGRVLAETCVLNAVVHLLDEKDAPKKETREWEALVQTGAAARADAERFADKLPGCQIKGTVKYWAAHLSFIEGLGYDALEEASEARSLLFESGNKASVGRCSILLGMIYKDLGKKDEAMDMLEDGMETSKASGDSAGEKMARDLLKPMGYFEKQNQGGGGGMNPAMMQMMMGGAGAMMPAAPAASTEVAAAPAAESGPTELAKPTITKAQIMPRLLQLANEVASGEDVGADIALMDAGVDSLAAVSFRNDIAKEYSIDLPAALMFDYPTINDLSDFVLAKILGEE